MRTAAENRGEEEFVQDIQFWEICGRTSDRRAKEVSARLDPSRSQPGAAPASRSAFTGLSGDSIDNEGEFATVLDFVSKFQPALVNRVKLHLKDTPIFKNCISTEIDKALRPKVWLKSGGYIVINQTEALVAIDVNTGKFVGKSNRLEDTIVVPTSTQCTVVRLRLRNLGGIIVVDFIDMERRKIVSASWRRSKKRCLDLSIKGAAVQ